MSAGGWIFLLVSWGVIVALMTFCYARAFSDDKPADKQASESLH